MSGQLTWLPALSPTKTKIRKNTQGEFIGTTNPRHLRVLLSLIIRGRTREHVDSIAGASNGPELIAELRRRGLHIDCIRVPGTDMDGRAIQFGVYSLTDTDRRKLSIYFRKLKEGVANECN